MKSIGFWEGFVDGYIAGLIEEYFDFYEEINLTYEVSPHGYGWKLCFEWKIGIIMGKSATYEDPPEDNEDVFDKQTFYFAFDTKVDKIKKDIFNQLEAISKLEDPECNIVE